MLVDVYADGTSINVADGVIRSSRRGRQHLTVRLSPVANRFAKGHKIRLDLAASHFPRIDINPHYRAGTSLTVLVGNKTRLTLPTRIQKKVKSQAEA